MAFDNILDDSSNYKDKAENLKQFTEKHKSKLIEANFTKFETYSKKMEEGLYRYIEKTNFYINDSKKMEKDRSIGVIFFGLGYFLIVSLTLISYKYLIEQLANFLNVFTYFTLIGLIIFEGYTSKFFFYYGDLCDGVSKTMYSGEFPVANKALGVYFNCLEKETKFNLYILNYQLSKFKNDNKKSLTDIILKDIGALEKNFNNLIDCTSVYKAVPVLEKNFCSKALQWFYTEIQLFLFLFVAVFCLAIAIGRIKILIWRKSEEIKSMMSNMEAIY